MPLIANTAISTHPPNAYTDVKGFVAAVKLMTATTKILVFMILSLVSSKFLLTPALDPTPGGVNGSYIKRPSCKNPYDSSGP